VKLRVPTYQEESIKQFVPRKNGLNVSISKKTTERNGHLPSPLYRHPSFFYLLHASPSSNPEGVEGDKE
jgi:hypothetical protein